MSKRMTKAALVAEIAEKAKVNKAQASRVLKHLADIACREAVNGFIVPGICKLSVIERKERRCRIPSTGQLVLIGAHNALKVVPIGAAKNRVSPRSGRTITVIKEEPKPETPVESVPAESTSAVDSSAPASPPPPSEPPTVPEGGNVVFMCPDCGAMISAPSSSAGEDGECPFCNAKIKIPEKSDDGSQPDGSAVEQVASTGDFILFTCQDCGQEIECASSMGGLTASCPTCGSQVTIPLSSTVEAPSDDEASADSGGSSSSMTMRIDLMDIE